MNYKQTTVAGERWNRFGRVEIANPLGGIATIALAEQSVVELGNDERIIQDLGCLMTTYDPEEKFALLDPSTGAETGKTITMADVYAYVHSFAIHCATQRDAAVQAQLDASSAA